MMKFLISSLCATTAMISAPAAAQLAAPAETGASAAADDPAIADIVVTAQKRSESVQNVALSVAALSGDTLTDRHIDGVAGLASSVPNMNFGTYGGAARISIRGIGFDTINPGGEGRVAYHLDGVYISRPGATFGTFFDVDRVEVLRGPQGTLYGRNATGGSINVITRQPTEDFEGYLRVGYGNYNDITAEGAVGGPINDAIGFRVAFATEDRDGYGKNVVTGKDIDDAKHRGARATLAMKLGEIGKFDLTGDYYHENDRNYGNHYLGQANPFITPSGFLFGGFVPASRRDIANNFDPSNDRTFWGLTGRAEFDLGGTTLRSITAYRHSKYLVRTDLDVTSAPLTDFSFFERGRQISQELQLSGDTGSLKYIVGGYYFDEKVFGGSAIPLDSALIGLPFGTVQGYRVEGHFRTKAAAGFGQLDYAIADRLTATLGMRYSWERHSIDDFQQFDVVRPYPPRLPDLPLFTRSASRSEHAFTPKAALEFRPRDKLLFYVSASKGFKSGGYNVGDNNNGFAPEKLWAYESGMKGTFADGRVRINLAGFYYDYTNLQVSKVVFANVLIENAASSTIYGAEAELTVVPVDGVQLEIAPAWLHSRYKDFESANPADPANPAPVVLDGKQLTQAPEISLNLAAQYSHEVGEGKLTLRGEMAFQDRIYFTPFNEKPVSREPNTKLNAFLNYAWRNFDLSIYGRNITNRTTIANGLVSSVAVGLPVTGTLDAPRTYGIQLGYRF